MQIWDYLLKKAFSNLITQRTPSKAKLLCHVWLLSINMFFKNWTLLQEVWPDLIFVFLRTIFYIYVALANIDAYSGKKKRTPTQEYKNIEPVCQTTTHRTIFKWRQNWYLHAPFCYTGSTVYRKLVYLCSVYSFVYIYAIYAIHIQSLTHVRW